MSDLSRHCPACGARGTGNFCARCGQPLAAADAERVCRSCGAIAELDALYCSECGAPVSGRPDRSLRDRLPWILSGLALVAFAVAISLMLGESTGERAEGMPPTGAVIPSPGATAGDPAIRTGPAGQASGRAGQMDPAGVDLSSMSGREAADRLFDRAMRTEASGDTAQARFFADMGIRAYEALPAAAADADAAFHLGLLRLMTGQPGAARRLADGMIADAPDHLLAWILRIRVAEATDDPAALARAQEGFRSALEAERGADRPEYGQHAALIAEQASRIGLTF